LHPVGSTTHAGVARLWLWLRLALASCTSVGQRAQAGIAAAWRDDTAIPLAHLIDETLTIESASQVQRQPLRAWHQRPAASRVADLSGVNAIDLIASNVGAAAYMLAA
jgi:hypothetical protein